MTDQVSPEGVPTPDVGATAPPQPQAQDTATAQQESAAESPPAVEAPKPEPKGPGKRIDELTRHWREEQRAHAQTRQQVERLLALVEQRQQTPAQSTAPEEKSLKDFGYDEAAFRKYERERAKAEAAETAKELAARFRREQQEIERRAKYDERVDAFRKTVEDYDDVVTPDTAVSEGMADAIMESDEAGALMYYLGNNPDVARKLYYMSPAKAGRELQKLEDRLVAERKKAAEKPVSSAPPPPPKLEGGGDLGPVKVDSAESDALSDAEWTKRRNAQERARQRKQREG